MKVLNKVGFLNVALCTMYLLILVICTACNSNTRVVTDDNRDNANVGNSGSALKQHQDYQPKAPEVIAHIKPEDISDFCRRLVFVGIALADDNYHFWAASPIWGPDGKVHLFASRWPVDKSKKNNDFSGLGNKCELAHYIADRPEGPFVFSDVALKGTGGTNWDALLAHNPDIKKVGSQYVLTYVSTRGGTGLQIGMAVSKSLHGPWKRIGRDGLVFGFTDGLTENNWDSQAVSLPNPYLVQFPNGKFHLYYRARLAHPQRPLEFNIGLAIADNLQGPYIRHPQRLINNSHLAPREDPCVFMENGKYYLLYHHTGRGEHPIANGANLIHESDDGIHFSQKPKLGIPPLNYYWSKQSQDGKPHPSYFPAAYRSDMPKILTKNGTPTHIYLACGTNIKAGPGTCNYVFRIKPRKK
ncbi:MAG: glycoside hydrolase family protein [Planctomycetota bacterium]|jgi:predicted GH43/DUF377 family glycosyl hydrolase